MTLEFVPTATLTQLLANNTSAASSFPGWPNSVAKPAAVGKGPLGMTQTAIAHDVGWFGESSHPDIGYNSADPAQAAKQVTDALARGFKAWSQLWHGASSQEDKTTRAKMAACQQLGAQFFTCIGTSTTSLRIGDSSFSVAQRTAALNSIFDYMRNTFYKSPAYLRDGGRPIQQFFGVSGVDWDAVRAHVTGWGVDQPKFAFRIEKSEKDGKYYQHQQVDINFGWTHCDDAWIQAVLALGKPIILGINGGFNSSISGPPVNCTWGNNNIIAQQGGQRWLAQLALGARYPVAQYPLLRYAMGVWNDYQEGNVLEVGLATGLTLGLTFADEPNTLTWSALSTVVERAVLYASQDGENLMPLPVDPATTSSVDLATLGLPTGAWKFVLVAMGKNSIQNVASNVVGVSEVLDWK